MYRREYHTSNPDQRYSYKKAEYSSWWYHIQCNNIIVLFSPCVSQVHKLQKISLRDMMISTSGASPDQIKATLPCELYVYRF